MIGKLLRSCLFGALALTACAVDGEGTAVDIPAANSLGIARFAVEETVDTTTVTGFDAAGAEVGRLDLVHGTFAVSPQFAEDYPGEARIDGRSVRVAMHGMPHYIYQTKGYEPMTRLPAHPAGQEELAAFLSDPHVKVVLDRWQIGWESVTDEDGEVSYVNATDTITGNINGYWANGGHSLTALLTSPTTNYGSPRTMSGSAVYANTCGGSGIAPTMAIRADRMRRDTSGNLIGDGSKEWIVTQVCADPNLWFGRKSCSLVNNDSRSRCQSSSTSTAGCSNCGSYDGLGYPFDLTGQPYGMNVDANNTTLRYCWGSTDTRTLSVSVSATGTYFGGVYINNYPGQMVAVQHTTASKQFTLCLNAQPFIQGQSNGGGYTVSEDFPGITGTSGTGLMDANHYFNLTAL